MTAPEDTGAPRGKSEEAVKLCRSLPGPVSAEIGDFRRFARYYEQPSVPRAGRDARF